MRPMIRPRVSYSKPSSQYRAEYDSSTRTVWGYYAPKGNPCFSLGLLKDIREHDERFAANHGKIEIDGMLHDVDYYVIGSQVPRVFSLGGDLALFVLLIRARDREALAHYARLCIDNMHPRIQNFSSSSLITISLVRGDALGGGFESALASDVLIAEESAQLGLPETLFNLFPGMGAYSFLARRIGRRAAEDLILSGRMYSARQLHDLGVVDVTVPDGQGERAVDEWITRSMKRRNGRLAVYRARKQVEAITREELDAITQIWVDTALRLTDRDLKLVGRIVQAQLRRMEGGDVSDITAEARTEP